MVPVAVSIGIWFLIVSVGRRQDSSASRVNRIRIASTPPKQPPTSVGIQECGHRISRAHMKSSHIGPTTIRGSETEQKKKKK